MIDDCTGRGLIGQEPVLPGIVAGLGLREAATVEELLTLLDSALAETELKRSQLAALATLEGKHAHPALRRVASLLDIPVLALPAAMLHRPVPNPSRRVELHLRLPSVAEAACLAFGPLLLEKRRSANATCALSLHGAPMSSAASAAATLSTSNAGP